jgi:hypothetical protein
VSARATPRRRASHLAGMIAWLVVVLYAAGAGADIWLEARLRSQSGNALEGAALLVGFGGFAVVGALLVAKRPANPIGWIMAAIALMVGLFPAGDAYAGYVMTTRGRPDALAILGAWAQGWYWFLLLSLMLIYLPLLFPDGRLPSRRWLPVAVLAGVGTLATVVLGALSETLTGQDVAYRIENPIGIEGLGPVEDLTVFGVLGIILGVGILGAVASVVVRFRRSRGAERQQMKWFVYAAALLPTFLISDYLPAIFGDVAFVLTIVALPTAIGIAVLRYRLYEIDLIVNRALVYGALTVMLVLVYVTCVAGLQYLFRSLAGGESQLAVVASTLAIAALFNPLRRRIQGFIDRRFYRTKYDATKTLAAFSARLRDETDLDALAEDVTSVVRETLQPRHVSLWLHPAPGARGSSGESAPQG